MNRRYDLHSHSLCSDGTLTPAALVARARAQGVDVLALTDHDATDGLAEARAAAKAAGIELIDGVEVSVTWDGRTVHIVGLRIDAGNDALQAGLSRLRAFRDWRAQEIDRRLARHRIRGMLEGARSRARGAIISRTHFARELVARGHAPDLRAAFKRFLTSGNPGYVPGQWATLAEAVGWIRGAGGVAVIAHPGRYRLTAGKLRRLIGEFKDAGGTAIEVLSGSHSASVASHFAGLAARHGLYASVGSDYHGPDNFAGSEIGRASARPAGASDRDVARQSPRVDIGRLPPLPAQCLPLWQSW